MTKYKVKCNDCGAVFTEIYPDGLHGDESYSDPNDPKPCGCPSQYTIVCNLCSGDLEEGYCRACDHPNSMGYI